MTTLLQVSDAHFGTERAPVVQALIRLAHAQKPEVVVLSGDITQRARRHQFNAARRFIDQVNPPAFMAIPGNHDIPLFNVLARVFSPYGNYSRVFGADLEPEFSADHLLLIGVNTTRPRRHKDGEISAAQIDRVAHRLRQAPAAQVRIVVVHQPVLVIRPGDKANLLHGHRQAVPAWSDAGADIIMGGHIHLPYVRSLRTTFASLPRDIWTVQAGTAVSSRIRERVPNSVNVIRCNGAVGTRECIVERWDFAAANERFELHTQQPLRFSADR
jgi:3',5'-cyclic AMP phosphodiesterase CpdA